MNAPNFIPAALGGSSRDFLLGVEKNPIERARRFADWENQRIQMGFFPYGKALVGKPLDTAELRYLDGAHQQGLNFSSQDYLSLSTHPQVCEAAVDAVQRCGVHSAGSAALAGNTMDGLALERELADWLHMPHAMLFPTGWAAGYGVTKALIRPQDHVVIDVLAHNCLHEGANAATRNVHLHRHLDVEHARKLLQRIRTKDNENAILLITEGLFSMDADSPDIAALQAAASEFDALLVVDVAHDLGCSGPNGTGQIGLQGQLGKVDLVMGAFSKTFASNGGFIASHHESVKEYFRYYAPSATFSNALSPIQIAVIRQCIRIVNGDEGHHRRGQLFAAIQALRDGLNENGIETLGNPSPIVPVMLGRDDVARVTSKLLSERGVLTNLVEFPAVSNNTARLRMQVMSQHTPAQCRRAARTIVAARQEATQMLQIARLEVN